MTHKSRATNADTEAIVNQDFTSPNPNLTNPLKRVQEVQGQPSPARKKRPKQTIHKLHEPAPSPAPEHPRQTSEPPEQTRAKHQPSPSLTTNPEGWTKAENRKGQYRYTPMVEQINQLASKNSFTVLRTDLTAYVANTIWVA